MSSYRDGHGHPHKQHVGPEANRHEPRLLSELMEQAIGDGTAQPKGQGHAGGADTQGDPPVAQQQAEVDLESDQEEEQDQPQVGDIGQVGNGLLGEDVLGEARNAAQGGGAEQNAADNLRDHAGLPDPRERVVQDAAEDDDDSGLWRRASADAGPEGPGGGGRRTWMIKTMIGFLGS